MKPLLSYYKRPFFIVSLMALISFTGCDSDLFEFSPYEVRVQDSYKSTTLKNINELAQFDKSNKDSIVFAVVADNHYHFHALNETVEDINQNYDVDFVVHAGDMADLGLQGEFEMFHDAMSRLVMPWFTVIGNHDYRSNGEKIYEEMFGNLNYSISTGFLRIVFFDDVFWESNRLPDFDWLETELAKDKDKVTLLVSHIPPDSRQFDEESKQRFLEILNKHQTNYSFHGHVHRFYTFTENETEFVTCPSTDKDKYLIVTAFPNGQVKFREVWYKDN